MSVLTERQRLEFIRAQLREMGRRALLRTAHPCAKCQKPVFSEHLECMKCSQESYAAQLEWERKHGQCVPS